MRVPTAIIAKLMSCVFDLEGGSVASVPPRKTL